MSRYISALTLCVSLCSVQLFAAPKIEAVNPTYDCGKLIDGKDVDARASFTIKNTGDMPLHLISVRPGCGCTVVKADSLVLPGKTSIISAKVNVAGFHTGQQTKVVNVTSDAANNQFLQLKIVLTVVNLIESSEQSIVIPIGGSHSLVITCEKRDLKVTDITFVQESATDNSEWSKQIPVPIPFAWLPLDSVCANNLKAFRLTLTSPAVSSELYGKIFLKTNHPDKPEFWITSSIVNSR